MSKQMRRVVVTGLGTVTPFGEDAGVFWSAMLAGRSAVSQIERFDTGNFPVTIAAEIKDFDPARYLERRDYRMMDRFVQYAVVAALQAWQDAGLPEVGGSALDGDRIGVAIGSGVGGTGSFQEHAAMLAEGGVKAVPPFHLPMFLPNMATAQVSIRFGATGPTTTVATACAAGANSIGDAFRMIERGDADVMLAGGSEAALHPMGLAGFCTARALSRRNSDPAGASRPFDNGRDGFVLGEGAAVLILESADHARARGAGVYAELAGYASTADSYNTTMPAPDGAGAARCMRLAIKDAGLTPEDIDYVNAHGTATKLGDRAETQAIKSVFGDHAYRLACSSTKSMTGHLLGASGAVEAAISALAVRHDEVPPTINLSEPEAECDLDYVAGGSRAMKTRVAMSNSFAFGGHNASLVFVQASQVD